MAKESFLRGAFILALASTISRIVGVIYMVLLPRIILDEGMGLLQLVRPIHYFAAVIAISGMPVAVSKLVAEKAANGSRQGVLRVFRLAMLVMTGTGLVAASAMVLSARFLADNVARDSGVYYTILALAPATFFLALSGGMRGFFQGMQYMVPTASSQICDQVVRVASTLFFAVRLMPRGVEYGVAGAAFGSMIGELISVLVLGLFYVFQKGSLLAEVAKHYREDKESCRSIIRRMAQLAFPVVIATILWPIMQMADTLLIPARMQAAGFGPEEVRDSVGYLGMALTISQFPNIVTVALATSLVPAISEAFALRSYRLIRYRTEEAIRISVIFGLPALAGLYALAEPISTMLFSYPQVGAPLRILAAGTLTLGLIQATTGVLQGLGLVMLPVRNLFVGVLVKLCLNYLLIGTSLGVLGAAWGSTGGWIVAALLNLISLWRKIYFGVYFLDVVVKPVVASIMLGVGVFHIHEILFHLLGRVLSTGMANTAATLLATVAGMIFYFLVLVFGGTITKKDVLLIPKVGDSLSRSLTDWGFLRR